MANVSQVEDATISYAVIPTTYLKTDFNRNIQYIYEYILNILYNEAGI
jgi:hypothetical protein